MVRVRIPTYMRIARIIADGPLSRAEIARRLGVNISTVHHGATDLHGLGFASSHTVKRSQIITLTVPLAEVERYFHGADGPARSSVPLLAQHWLGVAG